MKEFYQKIPSVDKLLLFDEIKNLISEYGRDFVIYNIRIVLKQFRKSESLQQSEEDILSRIMANIQHNISSKTQKNIKQLINGTGIIVNTNLGRSPIGKESWQRTLPILEGYSNLEFDLKKGKRGSRNEHLNELLSYFCKAESTMIVNNNAAALYLILNHFAKGKEVVVSRGELIEIGGSFRLPDIMQASNCLMKEVGTTNKTKASDYENAIQENTALLLKAHTSNYVIKGFTEDVSIQKLIEIGKRKNVPTVMDLGSGLLSKLHLPGFEKEESVQEVLFHDIDLVCFSGDKLLGGPQAGIIAGKKKYINQLKKNPLARVLRVGKTSLALLEDALLQALSPKVEQRNLVMKMLHTPKSELKKRAENIAKRLEKKDIQVKVVENFGTCGGGSTPEMKIPSYALHFPKPENNPLKEDEFAEQLYKTLLQAKLPIVGILKQGNFFIDILCILPEWADVMIESLQLSYRKL